MEKITEINISYKTILDSFEYEVLVKVDDQAYSGDSRVLLKDGSRFGVLVFGWGSCSGCDALQACETVQEVQELADFLYSQITWKESKAEMVDYLINHDWAGDVSGNSDESKQFVEGSLAILKNE